MLVSFLVVLDGPLLGQKFKVRQGLRIGRAIGEILIDDPKMSSLHAQVEVGPKGNLVLVDRESANGLRINGQKVKRVAMLPGVKFLAGKTAFQVIEEVVDEEPAPPATEPKPTATSVKRKPQAPSTAWREFLVSQVPLLAVRNLDEIMRIEAFRPALQLDFLEGIQMEQQILLGYGPRRFGSDVLDIELTEPLCPPLAFELLPENGEPFFRTQYPKLVLLNGQPVSSALLKEGDQIRIGQTLIKVSFAS